MVENAKILKPVAAAVAASAVAVLFGMLGRPFLTLFARRCGVEGSSRGTTRFAFSKLGYENHVK